MVSLFKSFKKKKEEAQKVPKIIDDPDEINLLKEAELGKVKAERDHLKREVEKVNKEKENIEKVNISKELALQKKSFFDNRYKAAFSLRKFYLNEFQGKKYDVMSFDFKTKFGQFHDFVILKDGQFSLVIKEGNEIKPIVTGPTIKSLLRHFRGLSDTVSKGFFVINLDSEGSYVEDVMEREINHIITDGNGEIFTSKISSEEFYKTLADKDEYINDLIAQVETYEETIRKQTDEKNSLISQTKMQRARAVTAETNQLEDLNRLKEIHQGYRSLVDENVDLAQQLRLSEKEKDNLESVRAKLTKIIKEVYSKTDKELAQADMDDAIDKVMRQIAPIITEKFAQPKTVAPPPTKVILKTRGTKTPLEKKYEKTDEGIGDDEEEMD